VGSRVLHKTHGKGVVLPPLPGGDNDLSVLVKFEGGKTVKVSAMGKDLIPVL
jgi:hypothetical protein